MIFCMYEHNQRICILAKRIFHARAIYSLIVCIDCHHDDVINGNIFRVTGHLCGEFTGHRWIPRTKASDAELWCFLWSGPNERLSKQSWGWWFETPLRPLWRHSNDSEKCWIEWVVWPEKQGPVSPVRQCHRNFASGCRTWKIEGWNHVCVVNSLRLHLQWLML